MPRLESICGDSAYRDQDGGLLKQTLIFSVVSEVAKFSVFVVEAK